MIFYPILNDQQIRLSLVLNIVHFRLQDQSQSLILHFLYKLELQGVRHIVDHVMIEDLFRLGDLIKYLKHLVYFDDSFAPSDFVQIVGDYVDTEQLVERPVEYHIYNLAWLVI